jgi:hypothetical protein
MHCFSKENNLGLGFVYFDVNEKYFQCLARMKNEWAGKENSQLPATSKGVV